MEDVGGNAGTVQEGRQHSLDLGLSPSCGTRVALGAEPTLAFVQIDNCLIVIFLRRHMIDALARVHADVALDATARNLRTNVVHRGEG